MHIKKINKSYLRDLSAYIDRVDVELAKLQTKIDTDTLNDTEKQYIKYLNRKSSEAAYDIVTHIYKNTYAPLRFLKNLVSPNT